jgi:hypothetical protein
MLTIVLLNLKLRNDRVTSDWHATATAFAQENPQKDAPLVYIGRRWVRQCPLRDGS